MEFKNMELKDIEASLYEARDAHKKAYRNHLVEILKECGLYGTDVATNYGGRAVRGQLRIEEHQYFEFPDLSFHNYTKSGNLSVNSCRKFYLSRSSSDKEIKRALLRDFVPIKEEAEKSIDAPDEERDTFNN